MYSVIPPSILKDNNLAIEFIPTAAENAGSAE